LSKLMIDQRDRDRIAEDLQTTLLVEAGAGSGKTTSLVGRLVALIETGSARVDNIAAITFTNKAADEMKERFRIELERKLQTASGPPRECLSAALENMNQMFIGTIHAFCGTLLRERPIEAGLDPVFTEMDDEADQAFRDRCWEEYLLQLEERGLQGPFQELLQLRVDVNTLKEVYHRVSLFTDVHIPATEAERPDFDVIRHSLFPMADEAYRFMPTSEPDKGWDTLQALLRTVVQKREYVDFSNDMRLLELALEFERKIDVTQNRWLDKKMAKEFKEHFQEWQVRVLFPFLQSWREYLYPKLIRFIVPALEYGQEKRLAAGMLNFQDLLMKTAELLREHPEVRKYFSDRYERLLVDEFQDTDPIQAEMMFLLTGDGDDPCEKDWRRLTPRAGSLFVVGDPKQSIYRFRRADIAVYNEVKERIRQCGAVLQLRANFRSIQDIGHFVNGQFIGRFPLRETEHQAAYVRMETVAPNPRTVKKALHGIYVLNYAKIPGGKEEVARVDAARIARYIAWACRGGNLMIQEKRGQDEYVLRPARPSDFLILTKTMEFIHLYAEQLDLQGIPADTSGSSAIYEEIHALGQLALCLADPSDKAALLSVLRGPLFGVSDRALFQYKQEGQGFSLFTLPEESQCSEHSLPVLHALSKLGIFLDWIKQHAALSAFSRIVEDLGILPFAAVQQAGATRAGTLIKVMQTLQQDPFASASWSALTEKLGAFCRDKGIEMSSLYAGGHQAVRVMNLHKAKGLEAPVVFLACPCGESDHDATQFIDRAKMPAEGYFTMIRQKGEYQKELIAQPAGWEQMNLQEREFMNAEHDRLLYVAATRAKQMVAISMYPEQPAKCPWTALTEWRELLRELDVPGDPGDLGDDAAYNRDGAAASISSIPHGGEADLVPHGGEMDLEEFKSSRQQKLEELSRPTYAEMSVTQLTKAGGEIPQWSAEGKGQAFGSVVHRALDALGKGSEALGKGLAVLGEERGRDQEQDREQEEGQLLDYIRMLAQQEGMDEKHVDEAHRILRETLRSDIWQRGLQARRKLHEVPIMIATKRPDEIASVTPAEGPDPEVAATSTTPSSVDNVLVKGVIDYLFEEEDGWVIVDFKTDSFDEANMEEFVRFYKPQVLAYASEWEKTFGYKVKEAGLYFTSHRKYVGLI
jgi:ATP-dependent helicase/nuclease subunit A